MVHLNCVTPSCLPVIPLGPSLTFALNVMQPLLPKSPEGGDASARAHEDAGHVGVRWQPEGGSPGQDTLRQALYPQTPNSYQPRQGGEENLTCLGLAYSEHGVFSKRTFHIGRDSLDL